MKQKLHILIVISLVSLYNAQSLEKDSINTIVEQQIKTIELKANKKLVERKIDRLVFNVENSVSATGGDAIDALKVTPGIKVQNDKVSIIGKGNILVLINDRPTQLSGDDLISYLKTLKSDEIKKIEVITNPSSKYTAEGNSGVLNIITKNTKKNTWNSSIRSVYQQASYATGSIGGNFNLQKNKLTFYSSINYLNGSIAPLETNNIFYPNITWQEVNNRRDYSNSLSTRLGLDYRFSDKITTGFTYGNFNSKPLIKDFTKSNLINPVTNITDSLIYNKGRNSNVRNSNIFNYHIIYNIDTIGRKLSIDFDYFNFNLSRNRNFTTERLNPDLTPIDSDYFTQNRNYGNQNINNFSLNFDMEHPMKWITFNYGFRFSHTKTNNDFDFYDVSNNSETLDESQSNSFIYKENTQSYYFSANKSISEKWEAKAGLRLENTKTEGFSKTLNQTTAINYTKLFPTFYLSYNPNENNSFSINYGRRINRPSYNYLNPFRWVSSPYSYTEGNPFLKPSFVNNLELEYSYKDKIITNLYYSGLKNGFEQLTVVDPMTNTQQIIPKNFIKSVTFGITQTLILKPFSWLNTNFTSDIYYSSTKSQVPVTLQSLKGWNGEFNLSNDIIINKKKTILFNIAYRLITKGVDNLDYNSFSNQLDTSLKLLAFDKKLVINLYANDILSSSRTTYTTYSNGIKNTFRNYYDERYLRLSIAYSFGKTFKKESYQNKNNEELERTE